MVGYKYKLVIIIITIKCSKVYFKKRYHISLRGEQDEVLKTKRTDIWSCRTKSRSSDCRQCLHFDKRRNPNVSLGTVYRNLNLLSDNGLLRKIAMPNAPDRFDGRIDEHYHMICRSCGSIFDLEADVLPQLTNNIMRGSGFVVQKAHLVVEGICKECNESICSHFDDNWRLNST